MDSRAYLLSTKDTKRHEENHVFFIHEGHERHEEKILRKIVTMFAPANRPTCSCPCFRSLMALWCRRYPIVSLFWYSLYSSVLLPRKLGYKEYLRISFDILLPRKLGYKEYLRIFSDILLPRKLGYKEYLRIFSDILLPRKLGYKEYLRIFSDILYTRACEVGGKSPSPFSF